MNIALKATFMALVMLAATGCNTTETPVNDTFMNVTMSDGELLSAKWQGLERFPPMYPVEEAIGGEQGCATVEYVITPDNQVTDIKVIESSSSGFAKEAKINVAKWRWRDLPKGIIDAPVKTQTRFEYCLEDGSGHCTEAKLATLTQCSGADVVTSVGVKMR